MAECSKCGSQNVENLFVWCIRDPHNDYPLDVEMICDSCPRPRNIFKDSKSRYDPDFHDKMFGLKDYNVPWAYLYHGPDDVMGICFECNGKVNMSEGYGHCYVPDSYWNGREDTSVAYCPSCFRERCKNHLDLEDERERPKLDSKLVDYWKKTDNGRLREVVTM